MHYKVTGKSLIKSLRCWDDWLMRTCTKTNLPFYVNILVIKITELTERFTQHCE